VARWAAHRGEQRLVGGTDRRARLPVVVREEVRGLVDPAVGGAAGRPVVGGGGAAPVEGSPETAEFLRAPPLFRHPPERSVDGGEPGL